MIGCVLAGAVLACGRSDARPGQIAASSRGKAEPRVWVADDMERYAATGQRFPRPPSLDNAIWKPGGVVRLFGLPGETLGLQVVVRAGSARLRSVTVDLNPGRGSRWLSDRGTVSRYVPFELPLSRRSGGVTPGESLGWERGLELSLDSLGKSLPEPLIPVEALANRGLYPLDVPSEQLRVVWFDVQIPTCGVSPGEYPATLRVASGGRQLDDISVLLEVGSGALPYRASPTMLYFDPKELIDRTGSPSSVTAYLQLVHRHQLSSIYPIVSVDDVDRFSDALDGKLFTSAARYDGPGQGVGADVVALGAYGSLGEPSPAHLAQLDAILSRLERLGITDRPGQTDVFLYAVDEACESPLPRQWHLALAQSASPRLSSLRVAQTCDLPPQEQPVDLVMMPSSRYSPSDAARAEAGAKDVWIYNGTIPYSGTFLSDAPLSSMRINPWIQARFGIKRWFYWESTFYNDDNPGGHGAFDPFATAETFHNRAGDHANGDGVLVYPGRQPGFPDNDWGFDGVIASERLKAWRRGIQDVGYIQLAATVDPDRTLAITALVVGRALDRAPAGTFPAFIGYPQRFERARRLLFDIIQSGVSRLPKEALRACSPRLDP